MQTKRFLKVFPLAFIVSFFINYMFQGFLLTSWNDKYLKGIRKPTSELNPAFIAIDLAVQMLFLTYFVLKLNKSKKYKSGFLIGFVFAAVLYIHFGLLNKFILPTGYPAQMIFSDVLAVGITYGIAGLVITLMDKKLKG